MDIKEVICCFMLLFYSCTPTASSLSNTSPSAVADLQAMMEDKVGSECQTNNYNYNMIRRRRSMAEEIKNEHGGVTSGQGGSGGNGGEGSRQPGSSAVVPIYAANSNRNSHHGKRSSATVTKPGPLVPALSATLMLLFLGFRV